MTPRQNLSKNPELALEDGAADNVREHFVVRRNEIVRRVVGTDGNFYETKLPFSLESRATLDDLHAEWDKSFLVAPSSPPWSAEHGHTVVVDLFAGVGGMSLGVREACRALGRSFEVACAAELEESAIDTYNANFGAGTAAKLDLSGLSSILASTKTPVEVELSRKVGQRPDILLAGPPCQGHSNLNNHTRRNDPKNELYFKTVRAVELLRPKIVLIENVPTVTSDTRRVVGRSLDALQELGYYVDSGVVSLVDLGVAQTRKRHLLVAIQGKDPAARRFRGKSVVQEVVAAFRTPARTLKWAIGDLLGQKTESYLDEIPEMSAATRERIAYLFERGLHELPDSQRPDCHRDGSHTYRSVYGRMHWDRPAPTITSGFFTMGRGRFVHPIRRRVMTAHEAARVQFFPDSFDWSGQTRRTSLSRAIGNAVPPKLSYVFALELLR